MHAVYFAECMKNWPVSFVLLNKYEYYLMQLFLVFINLDSDEYTSSKYSLNYNNLI